MVSVSLGSATRDTKVTISLLGQQISLERVGTNGDRAAAGCLLRELDGQVDALGVGGIDLGLHFAGRSYALPAARRLVADVVHTPVVDGGALKTVVERGLAQAVERELGDEVHPKRALITAAVGRYDSALSFVEASYETLFGDLGFALGIPVAVRSLRTLRRLGRLLLPLVRWLPFEHLYPTGVQQEAVVPRFGRWYDWATVIGGDCLYIRRHLPGRLEGKVVATNSTTAADVEAFRQRGVRYLVTTTPRLEGRTFGANVMEAALVALAGTGRPLTSEEIRGLVQELQWQPTILRLS